MTRTPESLSSQPSYDFVVETAESEVSARDLIHRFRDGLEGDYEQVMTAFKQRLDRFAQGIRGRLPRHFSDFVDDLLDGIQFPEFDVDALGYQVTQSQESGEETVERRRTAVFQAQDAQAFLSELDDQLQSLNRLSTLADIWQFTEGQIEKINAVTLRLESHLENLKVEQAVAKKSDDNDRIVLISNKLASQNDKIAAKMKRKVALLNTQAQLLKILGDDFVTEDDLESFDDLIRHDDFSASTPFLTSDLVMDLQKPLEREFTVKVEAVEQQLVKEAKRTVMRSRLRLALVGAPVLTAALIAGGYALFSSSDKTHSEQPGMERVVGDGSTEKSPELVDVIMQFFQQPVMKYLLTEDITAIENCRSINEFYMVAERVLNEIHGRQDFQLDHNNILKKGYAVTYRTAGLNSKPEIALSERYIAEMRRWLGDSVEVTLEGPPLVECDSMFMVHTTVVVVYGDRARVLGMSTPYDASSVVPNCLRPGGTIYSKADKVEATDLEIRQALLDGPYGSYFDADELSGVSIDDLPAYILRIMTEPKAMQAIMSDFSQIINAGGYLKLDTGYDGRSVISLESGFINRLHSKYPDTLVRLVVNGKLAQDDQFWFDPTTNLCDVVIQVAIQPAVYLPTSAISLPSTKNQSVNLAEWLGGHCD